MATVIDALIVTLGLDGSQFKKGAKETDQALAKTSDRATKTSKEMEAWGKNAAAAMGKLRNEVLGLLALFTAGRGIKNFVESTIGSTAALGRMSKNLGMSARDLATWKLAAQNAGGSAEAMAAQLKESQAAITAFKNGEAPDSVHQAIIYGVDPSKDLKDAETYLRARSAIIEKYLRTEGVDKARFVAEKMAINEDNFNPLRQGPEAFDRIRLSQSRLAQQQADLSGKAEAFRQKWDTVQNKLEAVGVENLTRLMPYLQRFADWLDQNQDKIEEWANQVIEAVKKFVEWADKAAESVGGWKNVLLALIGLQIASLATNLLSMAAALVKVGSALGVIGGAAGTSALGVLSKLAKGGVGLTLLTHSEELNKGEAEDLARLRKLGDADFARRGIGPDGKPLASPAGAGRGSINPTTAEFAAKYGPAAQKAAAALGVDVNTILGQWGLETGWGKSVIPGTNNLGNIKDFSGRGVSAKDNMTGSVDKYRAYGSPEEFADDYVNLIKRKYPKAVGVGGAEEFAKALKSGGYAEDPAYVSKLSRVAQMAALGPSAGAANAVQVAQASRAGAGRGSVNNTSTSETNINGPINVYSQAKDAEGIARDMKQALNNTLAAQANTGLG